MLILAILVFGMGIGWIANFVVRGGGKPDWPLLLLVGLLGSFVGGLLGSLVTGDGLALEPSGIIGSIVGAIVLLAAIDLVQRRRAARAAPKPGRDRAR